MQGLPLNRDESHTTAGTELQYSNRFFFTLPQNNIELDTFLVGQHIQTQLLVGCVKEHTRPQPSETTADET
jgi:hypothetical protein